jgi:ubiquinone/menaquinone biosynthesis C-methylase UbiE
MWTLMPDGPQQHHAEAGLTSESNSRAYYDEFSSRYEQRRGQNVPGGYHDLLDHLESSFVAKFGTGKDVLEVGCGTGLVLNRIRAFARTAKGIDLSEGMLEHARQRGLDVQQGSATALPFESDSFDVTCSFKVLAHIPDIAGALSEMARVTRPGGMILAEFYNPRSIRGLLRALGPKRRIGKSRKEDDVFTRFDTPEEVRTLTPPGCTFRTARGVRIITPAARVVDTPLLGRVFYRAEEALADGPLGRFAGFYIAGYEKNG